MEYYVTMGILKSMIKIKLYKHNNVEKKILDPQKFLLCKTLKTSKINNMS